MVSEQAHTGGRSWRKIGGKTYVLFRRAPTRSEAQRIAKETRAEGKAKSVRVMLLPPGDVKAWGRKGYGVYLR